MASDNDVILVVDANRQGIGFKSGIRKGDIIHAYNDEDIKGDIAKFETRMAESATSDLVTVRIERSEQYYTVNATGGDLSLKMLSRDSDVVRSSLRKAKQKANRNNEEKHENIELNSGPSDVSTQIPDTSDEVSIIPAKVDYSYTTDYGVAKLTTSIIAFAGWILVFAGAITTIIAVMKGINSKYGGLEYLSIISGVGTIFGGLAIVMGSQLTRVNIDSADYARETFKMAREEKARIENNRQKSAA